MYLNTRKVNILENTIQNKFNLKNYINLLNEIFKGEIKFNSNLNFATNVYAQFRSTVDSYLNIGTYRDPEGNAMVLGVVKLRENPTVERARAMQRNFAKDYFIKLEWGRKAAMIAFYSEESLDWRLSFVKIDAEIENEKLIKKITPAKRFSFLVGKNEKNHTAKKQLWSILADEDKKPLISDVEQIFSIEKVTNEFYESYKQKYLDLKEKLEKQDSFNELADKLDFTSEQYSKKLMGQLVFLYFLQKKGWLGVRANPTRVKPVDANKYVSTNIEQEIFHKVYKLQNGEYIRNSNELLKLSDKDVKVLNNIFKNTEYSEKWGQGEINFIRRIFDVANETGKNFFKEYLEPLFYEALNDERGGNTYFREFNCLIPFLNGGLFKTIDSGYYWRENEFILENEFFSNNNICKNGDVGDGILDIFDRYAFTVNEAEPLETDVAVDPEMLGKVFENLLDIKDRKSKGAFYTPREIVHYMCQESLINYLKTGTDINYDDIEQFIRYGDIISDEDKSKNAQKTGEFLMPKSIRVNSKKIDELLKDVRIADPAVGSGAFPLGMINEIVRARSNLNSYIFGKEISLYGNEFSIPMERKPYQMKLDTIQNSIHAVDIEPSAVDIAKLRLWLSLIVDEENFREIRPLPDLDYNIMCGNSLIDEFEGIKLFDDKLLVKSIGNTKESYEQTVFLPADEHVQISLFGEKNAERILTEIYRLQKENFSYIDDERRRQLKKRIDEYELLFVKETLKENGQVGRIKEIEDMWEKNAKPYFLWKLYFSKVFIEKGGFDIVIGNPPYIDSENMVRNMPGLRKIYAKSYKSARGNWDIFVLFVERGINLLCKNGCISYIVPNKIIAAEYSKELRNIMKNHYMAEIRDYSNVLVFKEADVYPITFLMNKSRSERHIKMSVMKSLLDISWQNKISNDYFSKSDKWDIFFAQDARSFNIFDKVLRNEPLCKLAQVKGSATVSEAYIIKDLLVNEKEYDKKLYFKFINTGTIDPFKSLWGKKKTKYIKESYMYPLVTKESLMKLFIKRYDDANSKKIIIGGMTKELECYYDKGEYLAGKSTVIVNESMIDLKYLLGILNSNLISQFYKLYFNSLSLSGGYFRIGAPQIKQLPIAVGSKNQQIVVIDLVNKIIEKPDTADELRLLNNLVYQIYNLSEEEIKIIEEN